MLVAVGGILYVIGMRGWLLAFAAVLVSGIVSLFLLMKQRNDAAVNLEHTVENWKHRRDHEDAGRLGRRSDPASGPAASRITPRRRSAARWRTG